MGCSRWRRSFSFRLLCAVLSALLVGLPLAPRHASAAIESSDAGAGDGFAFAEKASPANAPLVGAAKANATAWRDAPVGASGEFVYSIPVDMPPGRLGMSPHVAIDHSSSRRTQSSPVGVGWSLEMPMIRRSTLYSSPAVKKLTDESLTDDKRFAYDESRAIFESPAGVLVPLDAGAGPGPWGLVRGLLYVSERESSPVYYEFQNETQSGIKGGVWLEYDPSGVVRTYGGDATSHRRGQLTTELGTFAWLLLYEQDVHGNDIEYLYHNIEDQDRSALTSAQREPVLKQINWGGNRTLGISSLFTLTTEVSAQAGEHSLAQGNVLLDSRVDAVSVSGPEGIYWRYVLAYESGPMSGRQRLVSVTRRAPRAAGGATLEATRSWNFGYSDKTATVSWQRMDTEVPEAVYSEGYVDDDGVTMPSEGEAADQALNPSSSRSGTKFVDLDGDGKTDAVFHLAGSALPAAHVMAKRSFRTTWTNSKLELQAFGASRSLGGPWVYATELADLDADNDLDALRFPFALVSPEEAIAGQGTQAFCNIVNQRCCADVGIECTGGLPAMECYDGGRCVDLVAPEDAVIWPIEKLDAMAQGALRGYATGHAWTFDDFGQWAHDNALVQFPVATGDPFGPAGGSNLVTSSVVPSGPEGLCAVGSSACRGMQAVDMGTICARGTSQCTLPPSEVISDCVEYCEAVARQNHGDGQLPLPERHPNAPFGGKEFHALVYENNGGALVFDATARPALFDKWPLTTGQRTALMPKRRDDNSNQIDKFPYTTRALSDFLAPLADINADGRADVVLLKSLETPLAETCHENSYAFFPRTYLRQDDSFSFDEDSASHAAFSRSLRSILRDDYEEFCDMFHSTTLGGIACNTQGPVYPANENFNSFLMDVNGDGLPDLVVAKRPTTSTGATTCVDGHDVYLNRGYRFDFVEPSKRALTGEGWSSSTDVRASHPLARLRNYQPHTKARDCHINTGSTTGAGGTCSSRYESIGDAIPGMPMRAFSQVDLNADGRTDVVFASYDQMTQTRTGEVYLNTGRGFIRARDNAIAWPQVDYGLVFTLNGQSLLTDFVTSIEGAQAPSPLAREVTATGDVGRFADIDGDGLVDLITPGHCKVAKGALDSGVVGDGIKKTCLNGNCSLWRICKAGTWYRNLGGTPPDLLTSVKASSGSWLDVSYVAATAAGASDVVMSDHKPAGLMVVSQVRRGDSQAVGSPSETIALQYENYVRDPKSRDAIGFEKIHATFDNRAGLSLSTRRTYDVRHYVNSLPVPYPLRGKVVREEATTVGAGNQRYRIDSSEARTYWDVSSVNDGSCGRARVRPRTQVTRQCTGLGTDSRCVISASWTKTFDEDGFATETLSGELDASKLFSWEQAGAPFGFEPPFVGRVERQVHGYFRPAGLWRRGIVDDQAASEVRYDTASGSTPQPSADLLVVDRGFYPNGDIETETRVGVTPAACVTATGESADATVSYTYLDSGLLETVSQSAGGASRTMTYEPDPYELYPVLQTARFDRFVDGVKQVQGGVLSVHGQFDYRHGQATNITDANGKTFTTSYDSLGRTLSRSGPGGELLEEQSYQDDVASGRRWSQRKIYQSAGKWAEGRAYLDGADRVLAAVSWSADTNIVREAFNHYDGFGALVRSVLPERVTASDYETLAASAVGDAGTDRLLDAFGRLWLETLPDLRQRRWDYQPGWVRETSPRLTSTEQFSDWAGRVTTVQKRDVEGSLSGSWSYSRDALGRIERIDDGDGAARWLHWDGGGRLHQATLSHPANTTNPGWFEWCYAGDGNLLHATTPASREVRFVRDGLGRVAQEWHRGGDAGQGAGAAVTQLVRSFDYDNAARSSLGRLWRVSDDAGVREQSYDSYGRVDIAKLQAASWLANGSAVSDSSAGKTYAVDFGYDRQGALSSLAVTERASLTASTGISLGGADYVRDGRGRVTSVTRLGTSERFVGLVVYDELDRMRAASIGPGVLASWVFDPLSQWLDGIGYGTTSGELAVLSYGHDPNGNLIHEWRTDLHHRADVSRVEEAGAPAPAGVLSSKGHSYDGQDRLHTSDWIVGDVGLVRHEQYEYSPGGRVSWVDSQGLGRSTYGYDSPTTNQAVTSIDAPNVNRTLDYDDDGFTVTDSSQSAGATEQDHRDLAFDAQGCLRNIEQYGARVETVSTTQACDESGHRLIRRSEWRDGRTARVLDVFGVGEIRLDEGPSGGGGLWVMRLPINGTVVVEDARRLSDGALVADTSRVVLNDVRGSVVGEAPLAGGGGVHLVRGAEYGAWGERSAVAQGLGLPTHGFVGVEPDPGTELYYFGRRVYDPTSRRFDSADLFVLANPEQCVASVGDCNLFSYAGNDPVNVVDPTGMLGGTPGSEDRQLKAVAEQTREGVRDIRNATRDTSSSLGAALSEAGSGNWDRAKFFVGQAWDSFRSGVRATLALPQTGALFATAGAIAAEGGIAAKGVNLGERAAEIHEALHPIAQQMRTTAVLETTEGRIVAGGGPDLTPAQRALLGPGEVAAKMPGAHAEVTALSHASEAGMSPVNMAVTRDICPDCALSIEASGGTLTSPKTATWPRGE